MIEQFLRRRAVMGGGRKWDISNATYLGKYLDTSSQTTAGWHGFFRPDGTALYIISTSSPAVFQYTLSTPWDVSTATYSGKSFSFSGQSFNYNQGILFKPDGTKMYAANGSFGTSGVFQYTLSTPWDVSTASYDSASFNFTSAGMNLCYGLTVSDDGTKLIVQGQFGPIYELTFGTPWAVNTLSLIDTDASTSVPSSPIGVFVGDGGHKFFNSAIPDTIYQYSMSSPWDIDTLVYDGVSFSTAAEGDTHRGVFFKPDGKIFYVFKTGTNSGVYQYKC